MVNVPDSDNGIPGGSYDAFLAQQRAAGNPVVMPSGKKKPVDTGNTEPVQQNIPSSVSVAPQPDQPNQSVVVNIAKALGIDPNDNEALLQAGVDANSLVRDGRDVDTVNSAVDKINTERQAESDAANETIRRENKEAQLMASEDQRAADVQQNALKELDSYHLTTPMVGPLLPGQDRPTVDMGYDINSFLLKAESPGKAIQTLRNAGFSQEDISKAAHENLDLASAANKAAQQDDSVGNFAKFGANMVADMVVPGLSTAKNWSSLSGWQKVIYPALDVVTLVPIVGEGAKLLEVGAKAGSEGARIAALGGREAVEAAAKDASTALDDALAKRAAQKALYQTAVESADKATNPAMKQILQTATKYAAKDIAVMDKHIPSLMKSTQALNKLAESAKATDASNSIGSKVFKAAETVEQAPEKAKIGVQVGGAKFQTTAGQVVTKGGAALVAGTSGVTTIKDWKNLTPTQRAAGMAMALLPLGGFGKVRNAVENVTDPYKIPLKGIGQRAARGDYHPVPGTIWSKGGGEEGATTRLVIDKSVPPEQARDAMAELMRQLHSGETTNAEVDYAGHKVTLSGSGFQKTVGGNVAFSGTSFGEIFQKGTGSFGAKTNLETYLEKVNQKLAENKGVTIESKSYAKEVNPETGKVENKTAVTDVKSGVKVEGSEGGLYTGQSLYNKFSHHPASAGVERGKIDAGIILQTAGIDKLPRALANEKLTQMQQDAYRLFNGSRDADEMVEGFKRWHAFVEAENVVTNGTQLQRIQNLRSQLADKLGLGRGNYYTRDKTGRIELFQMYMEGGRTTPYTLKELYQLKGNALKNSLVDIGVGLKNKISEIRNKRPTQEEVLDTPKEIEDKVTTPSDAEAAKVNAKTKTGTAKSFSTQEEELRNESGERLNPEEERAKDIPAFSDDQSRITDTTSRGQTGVRSPDDIRSIATRQDEPARTTAPGPRRSSLDSDRSNRTEDSQPPDRNQPPDRSQPPDRNQPPDRGQPPDRTPPPDRTTPPRTPPSDRTPPPDRRPPDRGQPPRGGGENEHKNIKTDSNPDKQTFVPTQAEIEHAEVLKAGMGWWLLFSNGEKRFYLKLPDGAQNVGAGKGSGYSSLL